MDGWIKIHRRLLDWEWYDDNNVVRVFLHLLLTANYEPKKWHGQTIERGTLITGRIALAQETNLSEQQVRTALKKLESTGEITTKSTNQFTIITICNYERYQTTETAEQPTNQPTNNQQITNEQPTNNQRITTTKEIKNIKNEKNDNNILGEKTKQMEQVFQNGTNGTDNDNEYDNDNVYDNNTTITINSSDIVCAEKSAPQPKPTIEEREQDFMFKVANVGKGVYPDEMLRKFFDYWTEKNENGKKMRFEKEKVFDIKKRLATWASRDKEYKFKTKGYGDARNDTSSSDYVSTERIVAAGFAMAEAGL